MEKISLSKWREMTLDMQKQTFFFFFFFTIILVSILYSCLFPFVKSYLSPKHRWRLELAGTPVIQVVFALISPEVIVPGVQCCV